MAYGDLSGILTPKPQGSYATRTPSKSPDLSNVYGQDPSKTSYTVNGVNYNYAGIPISNTAPAPAPSGTGGGGGGTYDAEAARQAAIEAENQRKLQEGIGQTTGLIRNVLGLYNKLTGNVRAAGKSQNALLDKRYNEETSGLTDQFNQELPKIGRAYAARGAGESSYRGDAEQTATTGFQNQLRDIGTQREADAAKIGQYVAEQEGKISAEEGLLNRTLSEVPNITDLNELTQLRRAIERQMADVEAAQASNQSQEAYTARLGQIAPAADRMSGLRSTLSGVINGAAPAPLKRAVAQQIIGSSGLNTKEQDDLLREVNSQIA